MKPKFCFRYFGVPTFFLTLNPAEYEWKELAEYYAAIYPRMRNKKISEMCVFDPVIFVRFFFKRVEAVFKELILRKNGVLGNVIHFWRRIEYQRRGAPHVHCFVWVKDSPKLGVAPDHEVTAFIDKYITCRMPDEISEVVLYDRVVRFQTHKRPCLG